MVAGHRFSCLPRTCVLPGPGIKAVSPALADGFLTPGPPGKSYLDDFPGKPAQFCPQRPACMTQRKHITRRECFVIILLYIVIARDEAHRLALSIHLISATPPENFHCRNAPSADFLLSGSNYCPVDPVINNWGLWFSDVLSKSLSDVSLLAQLLPLRLLLSRQAHPFSGKQLSCSLEGLPCMKATHSYYFILIFFDVDHF